jgi:hypothetical protein
MAFPPGHFYSPIVDAADPFVIQAVRDRTAAPLPPGVNLNLPRMQDTLRKFAVHHSNWPFAARKESNHRFYYDNPFFGCHDASIYFSVLLEYRPRRVIEIGTGFTSCLLLDTNETFLNGKVGISLIDPSMDRLRDLTDARGLSCARLIERRLQEMPAEFFEQLGANDILFIDSSHVVKTGSDVNYYLFEILPRLAPGVLVHIHDILYPFEYPEGWVTGEKRSWNEAYAVRAFLQYNSAFEILYWNNFVYHRSGELLAQLMPLCMENEGGSLWLRKL